jgi:hypothetical protein
MKMSKTLANHKMSKSKRMKMSKTLPIEFCLLSTFQLLPASFRLFLLLSPP